MHAHLLKVFAFAEDGRIEGRAYFPGGSRARGASVEVLSAEGEVIAELETDEDGEFSYRAEAAVDHRIRVDNGEGHVAEWTVRGDELVVRDLDGAGAQRTGEAAPDTASRALEPPAAPPGLEAMIERAVARQVRPLREQLIAYEARVRLHDILGGLGYILGLVGIALWWRTRRRD